MDLTTKQEGFAVDFAKHGNATKAYKAHYSTGNMKDNTIYRRAFHVKSKVKARIKEIRDAIFDEEILSVKELAYKLSQRIKATDLIDDTGIRAGSELSKIMGYYEKQEAAVIDVNVIRYVKAPKVDN